MLYQILKADGGATVALVDELHYVKQSPTSTSRIAADEADAQGIAVAGTAYNLLGREPMEGLETVVALKVDSGGYILKTGESVHDIEDAMCEQDAATDERMSALEDAVCELDSIINS